MLKKELEVVWFTSPKKVNWDLGRVEESRSKNCFSKNCKKTWYNQYSLSKEIYKNILRNSKIVKKHFSIKELKNKNFNNSKVALIVAGGPSLRKKDFRNLITKNRKKFHIICAEGTLFYLLEKNYSRFSSYFRPT